MSAHSPEVYQNNDVRPMLEIWRARFSEKGMHVPLLSDSYLRELMATFPQEMTVYNLTVDGEVAATSVCCAMQKERYTTWIGGVSTRKGLQVNECHKWEIIQRAKAAGFKKLDLGGGDENLFRFKSKFGPALEPSCIVDRTDRAYKVREFAFKVLSDAKKRAFNVVPRAHL